MSLVLCPTLCPWCCVLPCVPGVVSYLVSLVFSVLLAHAAHERARLAGVLQAHELDGVDLVLGAQSLLVRFVRQGHSAMLGQGAGGVGELGAVSAQVGGTDRAVHGSSVALVLVTADYTLGGGE